MGKAALIALALILVLILGYVIGGITTFKVKVRQELRQLGIDKHLLRRYTEAIKVIRYLHGEDAIMTGITVDTEIYGRMDRLLEEHRKGTLQ